MSTATDAETTRAAQAEPFLKALFLAKKNLQLYPASNPTVGAAVDDAAAEWGMLVATGPVTLNIRRDAIVIEGTPVADPDGRFGRGAEDWYRRAVGAITFATEDDPAALRTLLVTLNRSVEDLLKSGGPAAQPEIEQLHTVTITHHESVKIVASAETAAALEVLAQRLEGLLGDLPPDDSDGTEQFFVGVAEGDPDRMAALQILLLSPERLTLMFQTFSLKVREQTGDDRGMMVTRLLRIIEAAGEIAADLPDEGARHRVYRGLADMVRGLDGGTQEPIIVHGLLPEVPKVGLASQVMRLFPVPEIANALTRSIIEAGETVLPIPETIGGLGLEADDQELLTILTQGQVESAGAMTPELSQMFADVLLGALPDGADVQLRGTESMIVRLPDGCPVGEQDVRWQRHEFRRARREARRAALRAQELDLLPLLLEFITMEERASDFTMLVGRAQSAIVEFLENRQYAAGLQLLQALQDQLLVRENQFTDEELEPLREAIASLVDANMTLELLRQLDAAEPESLEAKQIQQYFRQMGDPLVEHMLELLDRERSRHMRLLLCATIAQLAEGRSGVLAARLDHGQWYVARNVMTIAAQMGSAVALPLAMRAVRHAEPRVAREALKTLAKIRSPQAISAIAASLHASNVDVQASAASWLGIIGDPAAAAPLAQLLAHDPFGANQDLMLAVIKALGSLKTPEALAALEPLTRHWSWLPWRRRNAVRNAAAEALRGSGRRT